MKKITQKFFKKRKLMTMLPLLALPFTTLLFWALGGGQTEAKNQVKTEQGFNLKLPTPEVKEGFSGKLSIYEQAKRDSIKQQENEKISSYNTLWPQPFSKNDTMKNFYDSADYDSLIYPDGNEIKLRKQLATLEQQLNEAQQGIISDKGKVDVGKIREKENDNDNNKANTNVFSHYDMETKEDEVDPELTQLDGMLEKILDIQHPERVRTRIQAISADHRGTVYAVYTKPESPVVDLMRPADQYNSLSRDSDYNQEHPKLNAFYENGTPGIKVQVSNKAIPAIVSENQTLITGATIKLQLAKDVFINGVPIPKGSFVYGICSLEGERLKAEIKNIRYKNNLFPVSLSVYDVDGIEGVHIPGAISRDAAKQGMNRSIGGLNLYSMNPSIGAQAASAGIGAVKTLLRKKTKMVKANVRAGYQVLLVDQNQ